MSSLILRTTTPFLTVLLALVSVFILLRGHYEAGGGFVGGLLLAGGVAIYALSRGNQEACELIRISPRLLAGAGLLVAALSASAGLLVSGALFAPIRLGYLPGVGLVGSVALFDVAVYMVVAGVGSEILLTLEEEA